MLMKLTRGKVGCSFVGETVVPNSIRHCICTLCQWDEEIDPRFVSWTQFHQHFMHAFFVQNFDAKAGTYLEKGFSYKKARIKS